MGIALRLIGVQRLAVRVRDDSLLFVCARARRARCESNAHDIGSLCRAHALCVILMTPNICIDWPHCGGFHFCLTPANDGDGGGGGSNGAHRECDRQCGRCRGGHKIALNLHQWQLPRGHVQRVREPIRCIRVINQYKGNLKSRLLNGRIERL